MGRDRDQLVERLREGGCAKREIDAAEAAGKLAAFAVERALGGDERYTLSDLARASGQDTRFLRELMQAIGRPNPQRGKRAYTEEDLEAVRLIRRFLDAGLGPRVMLEGGRGITQCKAQTAEALHPPTGHALLPPAG